jgi:23S rRNA (adenine2030-N6)-methyltransferase
LKYQHIYHAGNFADVAKHVALVYCLDAAKRKDTPFFVLDTHAGRGKYDLRCASAQRSGEAERGVLRLINSGTDSPALAEYCRAIGALHGANYQHYPGSASLIGAALRPGDRAVFVEIEPAEARALIREVCSRGHIRADIEDGYIAQKALLPPPERRGIVFMDPPYESADEVDRVCRALADSYRRWPTGVFVVWYPIRDRVQRRTLHARFAALGLPKMMFADLCIHADEVALGLAGSGLILINPPFGADDFLTEAYQALQPILAEGGHGYVEVARLTSERIAR